MLGQSLLKFQYETFKRKHQKYINSIKLKIMERQVHLYQDTQLKRTTTGSKHGSI
jgi:hypothetical protein